MMERTKRRIVQFLAAGGLLLFAACGGDGIVPEEEHDGEALVLEVIDGGYAGEGGQAARAAESGSTLTFTAGDRVGVIITDGKGLLLADNIPYKYDGSTWVFDAGNSEGKTVAYYAAGATYTVYYPYSRNANGVTDEAGLKAIFVPRQDQREEESYCASDLMCCTTNEFSGDKLTVTLKHTYTLLSLFLAEKYTLADGKNTSIKVELLYDINLTIDNTLYYPYQTADNSLHCILPAGTTGEIRYYYSFGNTTRGGTITIGTTSWAANTRYAVSKDITLGAYTPDKALPGDFCCRNASDKVYFIPGEVTSLSQTQKNECKGIVFYTRDASSPEDAGGYDEFTTPPFGYIVSLDENTSQWGEGGGNHQSSPDIINGYYETYKVDQNNGFVEAGKAPALQWCRGKAKLADASPAVFSKWYMISVREMHLLRDRLDLIQANLTKAGGTPLQDNFYFTAGRMGYNGFYVHVLNPVTGSTDAGYMNNKVDHTYPYRAACAFKINN